MRQIFNVIVDTSLIRIYEEEKYHNQFLKSFINDFEDRSWMYKKFSNFLWNSIMESALTSRERNDLVGEPETILSRAAERIKPLSNELYNKLMDENDNSKTKEGGEIAEIILYGIMKSYYKAIVATPKIFYKQNRHDYAKGADSVHIVIEGNDSFSLWLGEAKFYSSIENSRLVKVIDSVLDTLSTDKIKKENSIITDLNEINNCEDVSVELYNRICKTLDADRSIDDLKCILNIPILLLYECDITKKQNSINENYIKEIEEYHIERSRVYFDKLIDESVKIQNFTSVKFHLLLFPVPDKKKIVQTYYRKAKSYSNDE